MIDENGLGLGTAAEGRPGKTVLVKNSSAVDLATLRDVYGYNTDPVNGDTVLFADVTSAVAACRASLGDKIKIAPGYTQTITTAAGLALSKAGISVEGLGVGNNRPVFTISSTDNTGSITMAGSNSKLRNVVIVCNDDGLTNALVVTGSNCEIDIETHDTSDAIEAATMVRLDTVSNVSLKIKHLGFPGNAGVALVRLDGCTDVDIDLDVGGKFSTAVVEFVDVASNHVVVTGEAGNYGTTNGTKTIIDTITGTSWYGKVEDTEAAALFSGGTSSAWASDDVSTIASSVATILTQTNKVDSLSLAVSPTAGSLARFLASGGTALGTQLADSKSILDALGSNGTTVVDAATSVLGAVGANNANNAFDSSLVTANRDGSVYERLEQLEVSLPKTITKVQTSPSGGADPLFTITGASIHVNSIWGVVTTVLVGAANGTLQATTTDPAGTTALSTTVAIDNDAKGTSYIFLGPTGILTPTTAGAAIIDNGSVTLTESQYIVPVGNINFLTSGALTGQITWHMNYMPSPLSVVTAA